MRFGEIDIPEPILEAQEENKLVIFAGAGVSKDPPSGFPDFEKLAEEAGEKYNDPRIPKEPIENYFGRLEDKNKGIHRYIRDLFKDRKASPNKLHKSISRLFKKESNIRIVTTNYELMLSLAVNEFQNKNCKEYHAPALPPGEDFNGIVYLHGSIDDDPKWLVLTDKDFGRAYLTQGWARRFLLSMFQNWTILFIGYSLNDTVIKYLARALPPDTKRYIFSRTKKIKDWKRLGINPIIVDVDENKFHSSELESIIKWGDNFQASLLDKEKVIREIVSGIPPVAEEQEDYLLKSLSVLSTVRFFTINAKDVKWLYWLNEKGVANSLFNPQTILDDIGYELSNWICHNFIISNPDDVIELYHKHDQQLNPEFWRNIAWSLCRDKNRPDPTTFSKWINILLNSVPKYSCQNNSIEYLLKECQYPQDKDSAISLFEYLTTPITITEPSFSSLFNPKSKERNIEISMELRGDENWLSESWKKYFKPYLVEFWRVLLPIVQAQLTKAFIVNKSLKKAHNDNDVSSWSRSSVEPHEQDKIRHSIDVLIDAGRDILNFVLDYDSGEGKKIIDNWFVSGIPLLKRIAINGIRYVKDMTPDDKIEWLIRNNLIFNFRLRHEVFQVIKDVFEKCTQKTQQKLIDLIKEQESE